MSVDGLDYVLGAHVVTGHHRRVYPLAQRCRLCVTILIFAGLHVRYCFIFGSLLLPGVMTAYRLRDLPAPSCSWPSALHVYHVLG